MLTGANPLENSSEYDFSGSGSRSANAGATTVTIPAPAPVPGGEIAASPRKTAGVRTTASATVATVRFARDASLEAVVVVAKGVGALVFVSAVMSWSCREGERRRPCSCGRRGEEGGDIWAWRFRERCARDDGGDLYEFADVERTGGHNILGVEATRSKAYRTENGCCRCIAGYKQGCSDL